MPKQSKKQSSVEKSFGRLYSDNPDWLEHARIPKLYWTATVEQEQSPSVFGFVRQLDSNLGSGYGMLLMGPNGIGKTFLSCGVLRAALLRTRKVMYITAPDLIQSFIHQKRFDADYTMGEAAENRDMLVLDDMGKEYRGSGSGYSELSLINLIRSRVTKQKSTIITTNLNLEAVEQLYTTEMRSLLSEACVEVTPQGVDRRRESTRKNELARRAGILLK